MGCTAGLPEGWRPRGGIPNVGSISLFSGSPTIPEGTRGMCIISDPDEGFTSGMMLWLGGGASGREESAAPFGSTGGRGCMKVERDRGGKSVLVSVQSSSIWARWFLEDKGWLEETSPVAAGSVCRVKNISGP